MRLCPWPVIARTLIVKVISMGKYLSLLSLLLVVATGMARADEAATNRSAKILSGLPLDMAVKQVRGNGKRLFASFEDPNCAYCKRLATDIIGMTDVTIYTFLYPILSADSREKAKAIWCSSDREKAWTNWMVNGIAPAAVNCDASMIDKVVALGRKLKIRGTPTIFLADGERISGAIPSMTLEMAISSPKVLAFQVEMERTAMSGEDLPRRTQPMEAAASRR